MRRAPVVALAFVCACGSKPKATPEHAGPMPAPLAAEPGLPPEAARPPLPAGPVAVPATVLGVAVLGDLAAQSAQLAQFVDAVEPGAGAFLTADTMATGIASAAAMPRLDGADLGKPVRIILVGPPKGVGLAAAVLVSVKDEAALRAAARQAGASMWPHRGYALVGAAAAVDVAGPWALTSAATQPVPDKPTLTLFGPAILATVGPELDKVRAAGAKRTGPPDAIMLAYLDALLAAAGQTREVSFTFEATAGAATLQVRAVPRDGTTFAAFVAKQRPSDFALLGRLFEIDAPIVAAGRIDFTPLKESFLALQKVLWESAYGPWNDAAQKSYDAWFQVLTGEVAAVVSLDRGLRARMIWGVSDPKRAGDALRLLQVWSAGAPAGGVPMKMTFKTKTGALRHKGVAFDELTFTFDKSALPADRRALIDKLYGPSLKIYMAVFDKVGAFVMGKDAAADARKLVDTSKKPPAKAPTAIDAALEDSRSRQESMVLLFDVAVMVGQMAPPSVVKAPPTKPTGSAMAVAIAADQGALRMRITVPVPQVKALRQLSLAPDRPASPRGGARASRRP